MALLHSSVEFALNDVLHLLVDSQDEILAGFGLALHSAEPLAARVHGDKHLARLAAQARLVAALDAAQAFVIETDIAQDLSRQLALRIEALGLLLEINAFKIQRANTVSRFLVDLARDPAEGARGVYAVEDLVRIVAEYLTEQGRSGGWIRNLAGDGEDGVYGNRHRQLVAIAVVDDAPLGSDIERALLLSLGALDVIAVLKDLQADKAPADHQQPNNEDACEEIKPPLGARGRSLGSHVPDRS